VFDSDVVIYDFSGPVNKQAVLGFSMNSTNGSNRNLFAVKLKKFTSHL
jgi:hypothetical protein